MLFRNIHDLHCKLYGHEGFPCGDDMENIEFKMYVPKAKFFGLTGLLLLKAVDANNDLDLLRKKLKITRVRNVAQSRINSFRNFLPAAADTFWMNLNSLAPTQPDILQNQVPKFFKKKINHLPPNILLKVLGVANPDPLPCF